MRRLLAITAIALLFAPVLQAEPKAAEELAAAVMKAHGSDQWGKVKIIRWTFAGKNKHVWNLKDQTDTITIGDKTMTVRVDQKPTNDDDKKAFARWTNDSYWLIAPLKAKDPGVMLSTAVDETINGKSYKVLHLAFQGVGMTPGDQYNWYIDPASMMLSYWDYMPKPDKKTRWSWEGYKDFNGIKLATEHKREGGGSGPNMSDVAVEFQ